MEKFLYDIPEKLYTRPLHVIASIFIVMFFLGYQPQDFLRYIPQDYKAPPEELMTGNPVLLYVHSNSCKECRAWVKKVMYRYRNSSLGDQAELIALDSQKDSELYTSYVRKTSPLQFILIDGKANYIDKRHGYMSFADIEKWFSKKM